MKTIISLVILLSSFQTLIIAQDITNTLGSNGYFFLQNNNSDVLLQVNSNGDFLFSDESMIGGYSQKSCMEYVKTGDDAALNLTTFQNSMGIYTNSMVNFYTIGGTLSVPSVIQQYSVVGELNAYSYINGSYQLGGAIRFSNYSTNNNYAETDIAFYTMNSVGEISSKMNIYSAGQVSISSLATGGANLAVNSTSGGILINTASDVRLKKDIQDYDRGLEILKNILPIYFRWNDKTGFDTTWINVGFSAQNIQKVIPEAIGERSDGYLGFDEKPIIATLVNAVKELDEKISLLERENKDLKRELVKYETIFTELANLKKTIQKVKEANISLTSK